MRPLISWQRRPGRQVAPAWVVGLCAVAAAPVLAGCAADEPRAAVTPSAASAAQVRALEVARLKALVDADLPTLRRAMADDYQQVTADGSLLTKAGTLDLVGSGDLDYLTFTPVTELQVRAQGDSAAVRYKSRLDVVARGVGRLSHYAWHTDVYERRAGRWQVVWSQATPVGRLPDPSPG